MSLYFITVSVEELPARFAPITPIKLHIRRASAVKIISLVAVLYVRSLRSDRSGLRADEIEVKCRRSTRNIRQC